ncbi:MAG TPA: hypothetical protein VIS51_10840 [Solirubrobacterales bacterium]
MAGANDPESPEKARRVFEARLAEHVSARDELLGAISNQHLVLTFGSASIIGVFVAGFLTWEDPANWAIFFAIPPISAWVLAMWLAEVVRMLRAVAFCREQAAVINKSLEVDQIDHPPIRWEAWRDQGPGRTITWSYISVVAVLSGAFLTAAPLGLITANWTTCWTAFSAIAFAGGFAALLAAVHAVFRQWTRPASKVGMPT